MSPRLLRLQVRHRAAEPERPIDDAPAHVAGDDALHAAENRVTGA